MQLSMHTVPIQLHLSPQMPHYPTFSLRHYLPAPFAKQKQEHDLEKDR